MMLLNECTDAGRRNQSLLGQRDVRLRSDQAAGSILRRSVLGRGGGWVAGLQTSPVGKVGEAGSNWPYANWSHHHIWHTLWVNGTVCGDSGLTVWHQALTVVVVFSALAQSFVDTRYQIPV